MARLRVVTVTFNNAAFVVRNLQHTLSATWDGDREVVVVDNASSDGTPNLIAREFPEVRLIRSPTNLGFGGGCNLAMRDLDNVDYVALINSDAFVTPRWLEPLRGALEMEPRLGAACPKILFEPTFTEVALSSPTFVPKGLDRRTLGLRVTGVRVDGGPDVFDRCLFPMGWSVPEDHARWTTGDARLWVPVDTGSQHIEVTLDSGGPRGFAVGKRFDVVNNAGLELTAELRGRDRGFLEPDGGSYDTPIDVWGWCGAAVLLRADYLRTAGLLDASFFLYYEDTELSWRGRKKGWQYRYVPTSVVRHAHARSSDTASALFDYLNQRNRLVMVNRHGNRLERTRVWAGFTREVTRAVWGEIARPLLHAQRPRPNLSRRWARAGVAACSRFSSRPVGT